MLLKGKENNVEGEEKMTIRKGEREGIRRSGNVRVLCVERDERGEKAK